MPSLPDAIVLLLAPFASLFDAPHLAQGADPADGGHSGPWPAHGVLGPVCAGPAGGGRLGPLPPCPQPGLLVVPGRQSGAAGQLVQHLAPTGPLHLVIDETLERRWGAKIEALGVYRDPVRSSHGHFVKAKGLRWVSLMLLTRVSWARRVWALPFLTVLAPSRRYHAARGRRHKTITDWARQMLCRLRRWLPDRELVVVGDRTYATLKLLAACQAMIPPITFLTRLRLDAVLHDPPPPRRPGQKGRPRIVGARQPSLQTVLTDPATKWTALRQRWPDGTKRRLLVATGTALRYHPGEPTVFLRWLLLRDPSGRREPQALLCTDPDWTPTAILTAYLQRWQVEVTFQEVRTHLGVETQCQGSAAAIARTTPVLLGLFSWLILVAHRLRRERALRPRQAAWYAKAVPTFSDVRACVRHVLWTRLPLFSLSPVAPDIQKRPQPPPAPLLAALCYSA